MTQPSKGTCSELVTPALKVPFSSVTWGVSELTSLSLCFLIQKTGVAMPCHKGHKSESMGTAW